MKGMKGNQVRVVCLTCGQHGFRVFRPDVVDDANAGWGQCSRLQGSDHVRCGGQLVPKRTQAEEKKLARARAELAALAGGERP
jgi:hypothetical protein